MSWGYGVFLRLLCLAAGYLFGCFLTAEVVARCTAGESARQIGSGNPGMANIMTHLGKRAGLLVLAGDVLKTAPLPAGSAGSLHRSCASRPCCTAGSVRCWGTTGPSGTTGTAARAWL